MVLERRNVLELFAGLLSGIAAHQTDHIFVNWPVRWDYLSRYVVGGLTVIFTFAMILSRLNRSALRDGLLSLCGAFGSVGVGVASAMVFDEMRKP
jgi:hypothetical protein